MRMRNMMMCFLLFIFSSPLMAEAIRLGRCYEIPEQAGVSYAPSVAMNAAGSAVIMWESSCPEGNRICCDVNCNRSSWGWLPSQVLDLSLSPLRLMRCSVDDANHSHHLWVTERKPGKYQLYVADADARAVQSFSFDLSSYRVAFRKNGELFLVRFFKEGSESPKFTLQELMPATGEFISIAPSSKNHYFHRKIFLDEFEIAVSPEGKDCVVWEEQDYPRTQIYFSEKQAEGQWSSPVCLYTSAKGVFLSDLKLAAGRDAQVAVVWAAFSPVMEGRHIYGMIRNGQGEWSQPQALAVSNQEMAHMNVMVDQEGNVLAVWEAVLQGRHEVWSVYKPACQEWGSPFCLSQSSSHYLAPHIQVYGSNRFVVVWQEVDGEGCCVHSRIFNGNAWSDDQVLSLGERSRQPAFAIEGTQGMMTWLKASGDGSWRVNYAHFGIY